MIIDKPSVEQVEIYFEQWKDKEKNNYVLKAKSLNKLFVKECPQNDNEKDVLIKVCALDNMYNTNVNKTKNGQVIVAKRIVELNIDQRLEDEDLTVVDDIASDKSGNKDSKRFYSFATKYCSFHRPKIYPIYDSRVHRALMRLKREKKGLLTFKGADLKEYLEFHKAVTEFIELYELQSCALKKIDKYLWLAGKKG